MDATPSLKPTLSGILRALSTAGLAALLVGLPVAALATPEKPESEGLGPPPITLPETPGEGPPIEMPPGLGELPEGFEEHPPFQGPPEGVPPEPETPVGPEGEHPLGEVPPPHFERPLPPQQVPEPSTLAILGAGLAGLALFGNRRRDRAAPARG